MGCDPRCPRVYAAGVLVPRSSQGVESPGGGGLRRQHAGDGRSARSRTAIASSIQALSDARHELANALKLPTFEFAGMTLIKRLTLIVERGGRIVRCLSPVFPPDRDAVRILDSLREPGGAHRISRTP